jgi:hypothetical protein
MLLNAPEKETDFDHPVTFNTAAAPPPESVLAGMARCGFRGDASLRADGNLRTGHA